MPFQQNFRQTLNGDEERTVDFSHVAPTFPRSWPDAVAFRETIQIPQSAFSDPQLRTAEVSLDRRGLPVAYSGRFAIVFRLNGANGEKWAVRCFTSGTDAEERRARYYLIASHIEDLGDIVVPFRYIDQGIHIGREWYPVLAMPWVSSEPLGRFVERNLRNPEALRRLAGVLSSLIGRLEAAGIAHGDWQHDNLLVSEAGAHVTMVDYDGMYVPDFAGRVSTEAGHPNYQHPARTAENFNAQLDRFSCLVIQTALLALANEPELWNRFSDGESLLFKRSDFVNPTASPLFRTLREIAGHAKDQLLADMIAALEDACRAPVESTLPSVVPPIEGVLEKSPQRTVSQQVTTNLFSQGPWYSTGASGKRWWQEETVTLRGGSTATRARVNQQEVFAFLQKLTQPEIETEERKNLWHARVVVPLALSLIVLSLYWIAQHAHFFPFYVFFWMFNLGSIGYGRWPRKRIYEELNAEIQKMQRLKEERIIRLANRRASLGLTDSLATFKADRLRKKSVSNLSGPPYNIRLDTINTLRQQGIDSALQLQHRTAVPGVSSPEMVMIQRWVETHEMEAENEYRILSGSSTPATNEMKRLQDEIGTFERAVEALVREREAFPDSSFKAYVRRLVGMDKRPSDTTIPAP